MIRFTDVDRDTETLVAEIIKKDFSHLVQAKIKIIFDIKKRKTMGQYVLGKLQKTNALIKYLTANESSDGTGFDYLLFIDETVFEAVDQKDKIRLIRHLLQYADIDYESDNPFKTRKEEVITWFDEIEFNIEDPRWYERLQTIAESIYEAEDEEKNMIKEENII